MAKQLFYILFAGVFLILSACSTNIREMPGDVISADYEGGSDVVVGDGPETTGLDGEGDLIMGTLGDGSLSSGNVVYFGYNSSEVRDDAMPLIASAAEVLVGNPAMQMRLEGHADERGTREFNLALGERRAQSVRELIMLQGVSGNQIDVVSYGEEKPAVVSSGEEAWQKNRRVELIY